MAPPTGKRPPIDLTDTTESRLINQAQRTFATCKVKPTPMKDRVEGQPFVSDAEAYKRTCDNVTKLFEMVRNHRDDAKPKSRERKVSDDVIADALGKPLGDLQAVYVNMPIVNGLTERLNLPTIKRYTETPSHPYHQFAVDYFAENNIRFIERAKSKGRSATVLERLPKEAPKAEPEGDQIAA